MVKNEKSAILFFFKKFVLLNMYLRKTDKLLVDGSILKFEKTHSKLFLSILHSQKYYGILISLKYCGYHGITIKKWVMRMGNHIGES